MAGHGAMNPIDPRFNASVLDDDFVKYYNDKIASKPFTHQATIADIRANPKKWAPLWDKDYSGSPGVKNLSITLKDGHNMNLRTYTPDEEKFGKGPYPVHVNYHGGGFIFGGLDMDGEWCMRMKNEVGILIVDVDYRRMPEVPYGTIVEDCWAALNWVRNNPGQLNSRSDSLSVGGLSAGGNLSCVMQHMARDTGIDLQMALIFVPSTICRPHIMYPTDAPFPSYVENAYAPCVNFARLTYFRETGEPWETRQHLPQLWNNPLHVDNFKGLCPIFLATAECDMVRDEGEAYGRKAAKAGVKVTHRRYTGVPHIFMYILELKKAKMFYADTIEALKIAHSLFK